MLLLKTAIPEALKAGKPGTEAFRVALRDALEKTHELVGVSGVYTMSPTNHNGQDASVPRCWSKCRTAPGGQSSSPIARGAWTLFIFFALLQDGITTGAIYLLLAIGLLIVFSVTRVIFVPQGDLLAFGALTAASLQSGHVPGTLWLLDGMSALALLASLRRGAWRGAIAWGVYPFVLTLASRLLAPWQQPASRSCSHWRSSRRWGR